MDFSMDLEWPTIIHNPYELWPFYGFEIHMDYGFFYGFEFHLNCSYFLGFPSFN